MFEGKTVFLFFLFSLVLIVNLFYVVFICIKTNFSFRTGVQSISQDIADNVYLRTFLFLLVFVFYAIHSVLKYYMYSVANKNKHKKNYLKSWSFRLNITASIRTLFLTLIFIFPIDVYRLAHTVFAFLAATFVFLFEVFNLEHRRRFIKHCTDRNPNYCKKYKKKKTRINPTPNEEVKCKHDGICLNHLQRIVLFNWAFVFISSILAITYFVLSFFTIEETSTYAVTEHMFFATIGIGLIFYFADVNF